MGHEYLKSGRQAVRLLYYLIIGLAITKSISTLFIDQSTNAFVLPTWDGIWLFIIFFSFISRFFLGAYRVLSYDVDIELRRPKIIMDLIGFSIQAVAFYIFSLNFYDRTYSHWMIITICTIDSIWLLFLAGFFNIWVNTFRQWIIHNLLMIGFVFLSIHYFNSTIPLLLLSLVAFSIDIIYNSNFYFGFDKNTVLKIFVAGPYGDDEPADVISANVEKAKKIGKSLALKGHIPFIPHTMLHGWELDSRFKVEDFKRIDFAWLDECDALYFMSESEGANVEKEIATQKGLQIFTSLRSVPKIKPKKKPQI